MFYRSKKLKKGLRMFSKMRIIFQKFDSLPSVVALMVRFEKYMEIFKIYIIRIQLDQEE